MSVFKKFAGQTAVYGVSTIISRLFNFILTPILTKVFPPKIYGVFTIMYGYASIINAILIFGMETTFFRFLNKNEDQKQPVYNNTFICVGFFAVLFLFSCFTFSHQIAEFIYSKPHATPKEYQLYLANFSSYQLYVKCFAFLLFFDAVCTIPFAKLRADGKPFRYSLIKFVSIGTFVAVTLFLVLGIPAIIKYQLPLYSWFTNWYQNGWIGYVFIANLISSSVTALLLLPEFLQIRFKFDKGLFAKMFAYSWPIVVANISFIINENLDKILLGKFLPAGISEIQVGIYGAVCKIAVFLSIFNTAFRLGAEPFFFSHAKNENAKQTYATILHYFVIALVLIFLGLVANIEVLKHFISGHDAKTTALYWSGVPAIPMLLFGYVCLGIYMNLSIWYRLSDQTRFGLYISAIGAIFTIVANIVLIPKFGYMGSAWVSMMAYLIMMVVSYVLGQKHYPIPYNLKRILLYVLSSLVLVWLSFWVFHRNIYIGNALVLGFMGFIYYLERASLKQILSKNN